MSGFFNSLTEITLQDLAAVGVFQPAYGFFLVFDEVYSFRRNFFLRFLKIFLIFAHVIKLNNYEEMPTVMAPARCMTRRAKPTGAIMPSAMAAILSKLGER